MTATNKVLITAQNVPAIDTTMYISPGGGKGTLIDKFRCTNYSAGAVTVSINLVRGASVAANPNLAVKTKSIAAGATELFPELIGAMLDPSDFISMIASAATSVNVLASGRELT